MIHTHNDNSVNFFAWKRREGGRWGFWGSLGCQGNLGGISRPQQSIKGVVYNKIDYQLTANDGGGVGHKNITCPYWGSGTFCCNMTKIPQVPPPLTFPLKIMWSPFKSFDPAPQAKSKDWSLDVSFQICGKELFIFSSIFIGRLK